MSVHLHAKKGHQKAVVKLFNSDCYYLKYTYLQVLYFINFVLNLREIKPFSLIFFFLKSLRSTKCYIYLLNIVRNVICNILATLHCESIKESKIVLFQKYMQHINTVTSWPSSQILSTYSHAILDLHARFNLHNIISEDNLVRFLSRRT